MTYQELRTRYQQAIAACELAKQAVQVTGQLLEHERHMWRQAEEELNLACVALLEEPIEAMKITEE